MLFSQPLDKKFTKTPNVFFEEVLCAKGTTFNEAKLMGYLIRNTLGYNHGASWINVSRSKLQSAGISYGSINPTISSCVKKGWILEIKQGDKGREERYLFLRTPRNEQIVHGLEKGDITLANLGSLIDMDIEDLGVQYGVRAQIAAATGIKNKQAVHFCTSYAQDKQSHSNDEQVSTANIEHGYSTDEQVYPHVGQVTYSRAEQGCSNLGQVPCTANEEDPYSNPEHVNKVSSQIYQGFEAPLKTITKKDNSLKEKNHNKQRQPHSVVVKNTPISAHDKFKYSEGEKTSDGALALALSVKKEEQYTDEVVMIQDRIINLFGHTISRKNVQSLILLAEQESVDLEAMIENTHQYHTQVKSCRSVFGAIHHAITNGGWDIPDSTMGLYSHRELLFAAQERTPRGIYNPPSAETIRVLYGLA